jgi:arginine decarboxylase
MLDYVGYKLDALRAAYHDKVAAAKLPVDESARLNAALEAGLTAYTYLSDEPLG